MLSLFHISNFLSKKVSWEICLEGLEKELANKALRPNPVSHPPFFNRVFQEPQPYFFVYILSMDVALVL